MWGRRSPWRKWPAERIAQRHEILDRFLHEDSALRDIHRLYLLLDGKSAALFAHVSIMIAACTFLAGSLDNDRTYEKAMFLALTVAYLLIAMMLLRVLNFNMYDFPDDALDQSTARNHFALAAKRRGLAHRRALRLTWWLTVLAIVAILSDVLQRASGNSALEVLRALLVRAGFNLL
jgi:hypothetical protein